MGRLTAIVGVIVAIVPVVYCARLVYYFLDTAGSVQDAQRIGLGPTVLGLAVVGLLFCIPLVLKIVRLFAGSDGSGSGGSGSGGRRRRSTWSDDDDGFDADAALARYLARKSAEAASGSATGRDAYDDGGVVQRRRGF